MVNPARAPGSWLLGEVADLLDEAGGHLGHDAEPQLAQWRVRLVEPLTLAVAGHQNAGKSTLVNALVGQRIAPTADTECTRVITQFRFGPDQARLVPRTGEPHLLWLSDRHLPDELPVKSADVAHLDVSLDFEPLRSITVVDTPGLSGDEGLASLTEEMLGLAGPDEQARLGLSGGVDVLLFVLGATLRATERDALRRFRRIFRGRYDFPANALGVLSRADQLAGEDGPWAEAQAKAAAHAAELKDYVAGVLPVMGKLAETTESGSFNETQAGWLRTIAALPAAVRENILGEPADFAESDVLSDSARNTLLDRLDLFGIKVLTRPENASRSAASMYDTLRDLSGVAALRARINVLYVRPAAVHKTARVLAGVTKLLDDADLSESVKEPLVNRIEKIRLSEEMHTLAELKALAALYTGRCRLGEPA
ncbi:dynamin family protein, partial [Mycobacterium sp.]|uniref:dynamin family protein n=1 Tax=Mycobacterium sp. TaxID=1785 RepID=UPI003BAEEC53